MTGEEAAKYFNVEVAEPVQAVAYMGDVDKFQNTPKKIKNKKHESLAEYKARLNFLKLKGEGYNE
jgi:hypothetical protein